MKNRKKQSCGALLMSVLMLLSLCHFSSTAHAANFVVSKIADTADGTCNSDCSLREAIIAANGKLLLHARIPQEVIDQAELAGVPNPPS